MKDVSCAALLAQPGRKDHLARMCSVCSSWPADRKKLFTCFECNFEGSQKHREDTAAGKLREKTAASSSVSQSKKISEKHISELSQEEWDDHPWCKYRMGFVCPCLSCLIRLGRTLCPEPAPEPKRLPGSCKRQLPALQKAASEPAPKRRTQ